MDTDLNFSEYKVKYLATGGFSRLYIAHPKSSEKPRLCLKFLKQSLLQSPVHISRFQEELSLLKNLQHSSLPQLVYDGSKNEKPCLAYRHIEGKTVLSLLQENVGENRKLLKNKDKPINWMIDNMNIYYATPRTRIISYIDTKLAINIMIQLLEILDYLHNLPEPIVHSDISPENLLLDYHKKLFLIDFGCARILNSDKDRMYKWIGKPSYLSPEQARGLSWDQRSDLYQAGIVFYELLCHHKKNFGINEQEARIIAANPPLLNQLYIPSFFYEFITKLLHIDIEQRWQSARECLNELKSITGKTPKTEPD